MALKNLNLHKNVAQDLPVVGSGAEIDSGNLKPSSDTSAVARTGLWVLGLGFGGFLLWAAIAPLDEGVPTHGIVTLDTKRKTVQHLSGGIV